MTIVTELDTVEQVKKQLNKLVNVIKIVELDPDMTIETEVLLIKVSINKDTQTLVMKKAQLSNARSVDVGQDFAVFELTGSSKDLDKFEKLMKPFGIIEMVRRWKNSTSNQSNRRRMETKIIYDDSINQVPN